MSSQSEVQSNESCTATNKKANSHDAVSGDTPEGTTDKQTEAPPTSRSGSNPYHFPERHLVQEGLNFNGVPLSKFPVSVDPITHVKRIRSLEMRSDDVIIAAYRKCGTHWVSEMLHMLVSGTTDYATQTKEFNMLEFVDDMTVLDKMTSPRLLNSHLYMAHLPEQVVEKKVKLVHLIRNPKDCTVSLYHHMKQLASDKLTFDNFLRAYISEDYVAYSHQPNYHRQLAQFEKDNPGHPVMHIYYEDLKRDPVPILEELARFVGVQASLDFCQDVASACGFDRLKQADVNRDMPKHMVGMFSNSSLSIYRKGVVGDWKNTFTVAQNEMFDQFMAAQEEKGIPYGFRWH